MTNLLSLVHSRKHFLQPALYSYFPIKIPHPQLSAPYEASDKVYISVGFMIVEHSKIKPAVQESVFTKT